MPNLDREMAILIRQNSQQKSFCKDLFENNFCWYKPKTENAFILANVK